MQNFHFKGKDELFDIKYLKDIQLNSIVPQISFFSFLKKSLELKLYWYKIWRFF